SFVADDINEASDVFVRYVETETTQLVSARAPALPSFPGPRASAIGASALLYSPAGSNAPSRASSILSADGRILLFAAQDGPLALGDTNGERDIFVRDLVAGTNAAVSIGLNGVFGKHVASLEGAISENGRYAFFTRRTEPFVLASG